MGLHVELENVYLLDVEFLSIFRRHVEVFRVKLFKFKTQNLLTFVLDLMEVLLWLDGCTLHLLFLLLGTSRIILLDSLGGLLEFLFECVEHFCCSIFIID